MSNMPRGTFMQVMEKYTKSLKAFISAQGFGHYSKPNGGIPKTDLDQSVQTSLGKADTALQGFTETDPTVPAWAKASSKPSYTQDEVGDGSTYKRVTSTEKSTWNNKGAYSKPSGGIPKTDLASAVQTSLGKADTALQSFTETDPTVPSWAKAASKPSYTASEVGLGNVGNFKAVSTVASQGLSDTEKANARTNIGGGTYSKPSGGIPKTDLTSAVQTSLGKADSALQSETDPTVPAWAKAASKPSYTASEVGLGNVGNFKAVSTVASQGLSDTEKSNARANIGAGTGNGTYSKPSGGIPKTDLASAVQTSLGLADKSLPHTTVSGSPDLDTYLTTGVYHITTQTATHAPTTNHATLFVDATVGTPYQIFKPDTTDTLWYTRHRSGSAWTSWVAMKFTDTTYSAATTSAAGLMSAADKTKLNGIASGAQVNDNGTNIAASTFATLADSGLIYEGSAIVKQGKHISGWLCVYVVGDTHFGPLVTINRAYLPASATRVLISQSDGVSDYEVGTNGVVDSSMTPIYAKASIQFNYVMA